ncbi:MULTISPECIES: glutathione S-transferase family protein [Paracoccus]|jgi:glutathione S-transferase|uniref:Glutathione S-transferase family protein n=2 Tax=Paracoccus TaxID=265 RepID=A0A5P2QNA0_9RHOB|nr:MULTISPECIES: glutathione S-transferase family protein [Paracoccus]AWX92938.1 glutathione S-transferase family protein [Paracoccus mutanolyticus]MBY0136445.1 glutathione S-transferase family protein [Paracoccus yeei]OWJ90694.1 glutathione S-transferase [Paracoccus yeei]QEU07468.1 glutathione S-transferase family protein [Paracoccus yeei]
MPKLIYHTGACSLAPHVVLEWIGAPYEEQAVEFGDRDLLAANPAGAVPVLIEDDGWTLTQCGAILHYLARKHPQADLAGGDDARAAAELDRWSSFFTGDLHPSFYPIFMPQRYTTSADPAARDAVQEAGRKLVRKRLKLLDAQLDGRDFILGRRSVVDAYAFPMIRWAANLLPEGIQAWPNVQALHDRIAADPAVQRVLAREEGE